MGLGPPVSSFKSWRGEGLELGRARRIGREVLSHRLRLRELRLAGARSCQTWSIGALGTEASTEPGKLLPKGFCFSEDFIRFSMYITCLLQIKAVFLFLFLFNLEAFHFLMLPYCTG